MLALTACASPGSSGGDPFARGLWPIYTADARPWAGLHTARAAGPFLHWERSSEARLFEARPLFSSLTSTEKRRWDVLYPLSGCRKRPDRALCSVLFLASSREDYQSGIRRRLLFFAFWGNTKEQVPYGGLFPFWGVFRERLGFARIDFLLWPLYSRARNGDYTETHLLWPFFGWGRGAGRSMIRIWPLFGYSKREGSYVRQFLLWPLIHRRVERLSARNPTYTFYVLPLYGRRDSGPQASRFYLFPLVLRQWHRERPEIWRTDWLWPFFSRGRGPDGATLFALRPFYIRSERPGEKQRSWLLGLVGRTEIHEPGLDQAYWRILWAGRVGTRTTKGEKLRHSDLWPFYRFRSFTDVEGVEHGYLRVPYLIPLRGLEPDGWNRHYNQLLELYSRRWSGTEVRSSLLFGARERRTSEREDWVSWGGLLHLRRRAVDLD